MDSFLLLFSETTLNYILFTSIGFMIIGFFLLIFNVQGMLEVTFILSMSLVIFYYFVTINDDIRVTPANYFQHLPKVEKAIYIENILDTKRPITIHKYILIHHEYIHHKFVKPKTHKKVPNLESIPEMKNQLNALE